MVTQQQLSRELNKLKTDLQRKEDFEKLQSEIHALNVGLEKCKTDYRKLHDKLEKQAEDIRSLRLNDVLLRTKCELLDMKQHPNIWYIG